MSGPLPSAAAAGEPVTEDRSAAALSRLRAVLDEAPSGFGLSSAERDAIDNACGKGAAVYGELEDDGILRLLRRLELGPADTFVDLGSGTGRIPLLAACGTRTGRAVGVELAAHRHRSALGLRDDLLDGLPPADAYALAARIQLIHADLRDVGLDTATVVYAGATCFPDELLYTMCRRIQDEAPLLRRLILTRPLPPPFDRVFPAVAELDLPASWSPRVRVHVHGAPQRRAP